MSQKRLYHRAETDKEFGGWTFEFGLKAFYIEKAKSLVGTRVRKVTYLAIKFPVSIVVMTDTDFQCEKI